MYHTDTNQGRECGRSTRTRASIRTQAVSNGWRWTTDDEWRVEGERMAGWPDAGDNGRQQQRGRTTAAPAATASNANKGGGVQMKAGGRGERERERVRGVWTGIGVRTSTGVV